MGVDPLAEFADRDRETRDRIRLVIDRRGTFPTPYETHAAANADLLAAYTARVDLLDEMLGHVGPLGGVLYGLLLDVMVAARHDRHQAERDLATDLSWEPEWRQALAWRSYEPNLAAVA